MRTDDVRELRRVVADLQRRVDGVWSRVPDSGGAGDHAHAFCKAGEPCSGDQTSVVVSLASSQVFGTSSGPADASRVANVDAWTVADGEYLIAVRGDYPRWRPDTSYGGGDIVTYDNGGGLKRWSRDSSGTSGSSFVALDWTEIESANGWKIGHVPHAVSTGTAATDSNSGNAFLAFNTTLVGTPSHVLSTVNPGLVPVTAGDVVVVWVLREVFGDPESAIVIQSETASAGGGGGGADEKVASQSGQTADYLSAVLVDAPGGLGADEYGVDMVLSGATMYGKVTVPVPSADNDRLVIGTCTAAVNADDASYTLTGGLGLADGDDPAGNITVHNPIASYKSGDTVVAIWHDTAGQWIDFTPTKYGLLKGLTNGAVSYAANGWSVDNLEILAGSRDPAAASVLGNKALRPYRDNEEVYLIWNDENEQWEDFTPRQFRMVKGLTTGVVTSGTSSFSIDNVSALASGANPVASTADGVTLSISTATKDYANNDEVIAVWDEPNQVWKDISGGDEAERFDFLLTFGQSLSAGSWNDGTRVWTDGSGTVTLLTDNGDGTYDEAGTQVIQWPPNIAITPSSGRAYRGRGTVKNGVYVGDWVYSCEHVAWTSGA